MTSALRYQLLPVESGVFAELYLPKKAHYQGLLYETLTTGFLIEKVREHFRGKRELILDYLARSVRFWEAPSTMGAGDSYLLSEDFIAQFPDLLHGYTMYEVDGVFRSPRTGRVMEERTQVVRLIFASDLEQRVSQLDFLKPENRDDADVLARAYIRSHHWDRLKFLRDSAHWPTRTVFSDLEAARIVDTAAEWAQALVVFLFGYVAHELCDGIRQLHADQRVDPEEEIWVTFFWNLVISRIQGTTG